MGQGAGARWFSAILLLLCLTPGIAIILVAIFHTYPRDSGILPFWIPLDYLNLWTGGTLAHAGGLKILYTPLGYFTWLKDTYNMQRSVWMWGYPPVLLLLAVPIAQFSAGYGYVIFTILSVAVLLWVLRRCRQSWTVCFAILLSPAATLTATGGQNGLLSGAFTVGALMLVDDSPALAGILAGALIFKPHLGVLLPIAYLAGRRWRVLGWSAASATVLVSASIFAFGWRPWLWFVTISSPYMTKYTLATTYLSVDFHSLMASPFVVAMWAGASPTVCAAVQLVAAAFVIVWTWRAWRMNGVDTALRAALTTSLAICVSPYVFVYDLVGVASAVVLVAQLPQTGGARKGEATILWGVWTWPLVSLVAREHLPPLAAVLTLAFAVYVWLRIQSDACQGKTVESCGNVNQSLETH